jgi:two-component system, cell cycle sensor histidine kinase and response regulator CckA
MSKSDSTKKADDLATAVTALRAALEGAADGVVSTDEQGRVTSWNKKFLNIWGLPEELVSLRDIQKIRGTIAQQTKDSGQFLARIAAIEASKEKSFDLLELIDGRLVERYSEVISAGGKAAGRVWSFRIVAERQHSDLAARRLAAIVDNSEDAIIGKDLNSIITSWNKGAERIFGYSAEEMIGTSIMRLIPLERQAEEEEILSRIKRGDRYDHFDTIRVTKDGRQLHVSLTISPIKDANGYVVGASKIARDITERKLAEKALAEAQKMEAIGQLAGGVAHDFNNLLSVISGHSELLARLSTPDERWQDSIKEIRRAIELGAASIEQLLAFSRRQILEPKVLDLNAVVADAEKLMRRLIGEDVHLTTSLQAGLSPVRADLAQLNQVILNLAVNGRDAMPRGGSLILETREVEVGMADAKAYLEFVPGRYVLLSVTDTGCGMTPEVQARIFEPFFTTKSEGKGTGLGLSVALGIIRQSGGYLDVESKPGEGTRFKIYLPAVQEPAEGPESAQRTRVDPVGGGETVLLVEDEDMVRNVTTLLLESLGYRVLKAANGQQAMRLFETSSEKIDLLMTDVVMPDMTGQEVAEALLARDPSLTVIFQSGYTDDVMVRQGIWDAQVAFLKKPFSREVLSQKVREVLDRPHSH